ncbi:Glycerophosphodiester phosphodiesterase GDPDL3 [Chytriomyces hyalinus]|nr:Glycerophosphodiester phosphodiesterase GDPDL3 [Chytriomyces hyalinus]
MTIFWLMLVVQEYSCQGSSVLNMNQICAVKRRRVHPLQPPHSGDASTPLLNTRTKTNNEKTRRFNDMTFGAICLIVGAGIGSVITFLATKGENSIGSVPGSGIISSALNRSSDPIVHVPGWMAERIFHSNAIVCPWTTNPLNDTDCQFRRSEINRMRDAISLCNDPLARNFETIGHRGAALVAPEETLRSYEIAVDSGAGFIECDASVTKEMDLICRHSVCDLHYTTDILMHHPNLAAKCSSPFTPAVTNTTKASATCCTFDFTLDEMKQLCATMESDLNPNATRVQDYVLGKPAFRSIGVRDGECVKMVTMKEFLEFAKTKRVNVIPELKDTTEHSTMSFLKSKGASIETLADLFAKNLRDAGFSAPFDKTYKDAGKNGTLGIMQTFDRRVAKIWKQNNKDLPVLYLIQSPMNTTTIEKDCASASDCGTPDVLRNLMKLGVEIFAPALNGLVAAAKNHRYVEHQYSKDIKALAKELGLKDKVFLGSWSLERSACVSQYGDGTFNAEAGLGAIGGCGWYYNSVEGYASFGQHEDALLMMDALFTKAGVVSLFSDFPATVSMYSNCVLKRS